MINRDTFHIGALRAGTNTLSNYKLTHLEGCNTGHFNRHSVSVFWGE